MLYLYHGTTSVCSAKVRLVLAEKGLDWSGETLDLQRGDQHRPEYVALNPNAVVPTLDHDGRIVIESTLIAEYLDELQPEPPLMPTDIYDRAIARLWMKKIDDWLHAACSTVTFATANRKAMLRLSPEALEERLARIPDPAYRERQRLSVKDGLAAPHVAEAVRRYDKYITEMDGALAGLPYLVGAAYSLADAAATPYVNRAELIGMDVLWRDGRRPNVAAWLARVRARPSYKPAIDDAMTDGDRQRFDVPKAETESRVREILGI